VTNLEFLKIMKGMYESGETEMASVDKYGLMRENRWLRERLEGMHDLYSKLVDENEKIRRQRDKALQEAGQ